MSTKHLKYIFTGLSGVILFSLLLAYTQTPAPADKTTEVTPRKVLQTGDSVSPRPVEQPTLFSDTEFYQTILNNNLFRPLGWRPPRPKNSYRLLGTIIPTDGNGQPQAILQTTMGNQTHIVTAGDTLDADTRVVDIQSKHVTLERAKLQRKVTLNATPLIK